MEAYIDESGDEGTDGRGTRWLTFGAVCVPDAQVANLKSMVDASAKLLARTNQPRQIHFNELSHPDRKGVIGLFGLPTQEWTGIVVATDTQRIFPGSPLRHPTWHYNYALRYTIERVTEYAASIREHATIYIEQRRNFDVTSYREYLARLQFRRERFFAWDWFDPAHVYVAEKKGVCKGLCVADALAHAAFKALEPDRKWRHFERSYLEGLWAKIWRGPSGGTLFTHGFLTMPTSAWGSVITEYPWLPEWRQR